MSVRGKIASAAAITVVAASSAVAGTGVAQADQVWGFRLSNFSSMVATVCVETDRQLQCTGRVVNGTSRVYDVAFNDPNSFRCHANLDLIDSRHSRNFSRDEFKECILLGESDIGHAKAWLVAKRPDGSTAPID